MNKPNHYGIFYIYPVLLCNSPITVISAIASPSNRRKNKVLKKIKFGKFLSKSSKGSKNYILEAFFIVI